MAFVVDQLSSEVVAEKKEILKRISFTLNPGELLVVMGPNGSGKTSLAMTLIGSERYRVTSGKILLNGKDVSELPVEERAKAGLFLAFQAPPEIRSVRFRTLLADALKARGVEEPNRLISPVFERVGLPSEFLKREVYVGFSGGERKRGEMAQLLLMNPQYAILDEPDTGVDVDSMKLIAGAIREALNDGVGIILITHYARILTLLPQKYSVKILKNGRFVASGGPELAETIELKGFQAVGGNGE
ncbi:MAG: Fe-S cluster assembly ATPase SufC [Calditrichaeota bacterium]|nr:Fe-S cluster assembly ATPase SufC [Calditrichota bacterium]